MNLRTTHYALRTRNAFTIIELLVVIAIIGVALASLVGLAAFSLNTSIRTKAVTEATALAQEELEAVRNFRDTVSWGNDDPANRYDGLGVVSLGTNYYPALSSAAPPDWMLLAGTETISGFTRRVVFSQIYRDDTSQNIVAPGCSGCSLDPDTKSVTATVSWLERGTTRNVELTTYLTNWK
jgi:prepilin-type N-terminal cleavage/methylation domain-containing protein